MSGPELGNQAADPTLERYRALVDVADLIAQRRDLRGLFHDLAERLHGVVSFDFLIFVLHDPDRNLMCLNILENLSPGALPLPIEIGINESSSGWVWENQRPLVFANIWRETRFPKVMQVLRDFGIKSYGLLPLTTAQRRLGALGFGSKQEAVYSEADLEFLQRVAGQVAVAVDNALNSQSLELYRQQLATGRAEAALRQSEERFRTVVESIDDSLTRFRHWRYFVTFLPPKSLGNNRSFQFNSHILKGLANLLKTVQFGSQTAVSIKHEYHTANNLRPAGTRPGRAV